jgi:hypothetical protein
MLLHGAGIPVKEINENSPLKAKRPRIKFLNYLRKKPDLSINGHFNGEDMETVSPTADSPLLS